MAGGQRRSGVGAARDRLVTASGGMGGRKVQFLVLFVDICLFKKGPQDVPASRFLMVLALIAYAIVGELLLSVEADWWVAGQQVVVEAALLLGYTAAVLYFVGRGSRFLQTATALLATDAIISTPGALVLHWWLANPAVRAFQMVLFALMIWHIAVVGHILRHALSRPLSNGFVLAVLYVVLSYQVMNALFTTPAPT